MITVRAQLTKMRASLMSRIEAIDLLLKEEPTTKKSSPRTTANGTHKIRTLQGIQSHLRSGPDGGTTEISLVAQFFNKNSSGIYNINKLADALDINASSASYACNRLFRLGYLHRERRGVYRKATG